VEEALAVKSENYERCLPASAGLDMTKGEIFE
jgi:hypothetical protein